jgi:PadR family transcriptional regulator, regulatory protein AphA
MSLRHALLGLLAVNPSTGYEMTQRFSGSLAHAWYAGHSQIYPELARLAGDGLAEVVGEGARGSRTYAITPAGREELRHWVVEGEAVRTQRNETALRWFMLSLLEGEDRRRAVERELANAQAELATIRETAARADTLPAPSPFRPTLDLGERLTAVMCDWLREQLDTVSKGTDGE